MRLETATNYDLLHGEAIAIGMAVEARLAVRLRLADAAVEARQNDCRPFWLSHKDTAGFPSAADRADSS